MEVEDGEKKKPVVPPDGLTLDQVAIDVELLHNDCERLGTMEVTSRRWYHWYARFSVAAIVGMVVSSFPLLYFAHGKEYRVWRLRHPRKAANYYTAGGSLLTFSLMAMFVLTSPFGFVHRYREALKAMGRYDAEAWQAKLLQTKIAQANPPLDEAYQRFVEISERMKKISSV